MPPKVTRLLLGIARGAVAAITLLCANILAFYATIVYTPTWSYQSPFYYTLVMTLANFGGALVPGYFSRTPKGALSMALILGICWGVVAGLVLWYMGIILAVVIILGTLIGYRYIRGEASVRPAESPVPASPQTPASA